MVRHRAFSFDKFLILFQHISSRTFFHRARKELAPQVDDVDGLTAEEIVALPLTSKEQAHRSRNRRAFNVFVSYYVLNFKLMHPHEQHQKVFEMLEIRADNQDGFYSDEDSTDSHIERREQSVEYKFSFKCACRKWNCLREEIKEAWVQRTVNLNGRFLPGAFVNIPNCIGGGDLNRVRTSVLSSLSRDWRVILAIMKSAITRSRRQDGISLTVHRFGKERVKLRLQTYRKFLLPSLLNLVLFGGDSYSHLTNREVVYKTRRIVVIHIASQRRMREMFTVVEECGVEFVVGGIMNTCCGVVNVQVRGEGGGCKNVKGYIVDECDRKYNIVLGNGERIKMNTLNYDVVDCMYKYDLNFDRRNRKITHYDPIRLMIAQNGFCSTTLNRLRYFYNKHNNNIVPL